MERRTGALIAAGVVFGSVALYLWLRKGASDTTSAPSSESEQEAGTVEKLTATFGGRMSGPRWDRLTPEAKAKATELLNAAQAQGLDVMFWDGWRDPEEEKKHIADGTSKLKDPLNTLHAWGTAFDIVFRNAIGGPTWPPSNDPRWRQLAELGANLGLFSGGLTWGWDWPHFQLAGITAADLRARYGSDFLAYLTDSGATVA